MTAVAEYKEYKAQIDGRALATKRKEIGLLSERYHIPVRLSGGRLELTWAGRSDTARDLLQDIAKEIGEASGTIEIKLFYVGDEEYEEIERYRIRDGRLELIEKHRSSL